MVRLSYQFKIKASFEEVWGYFSEFSNISQYDPCVKSTTTITDIKGPIGKKYDVITLFNGKEGKMIYEVTKYSQKKENSLRNFSVQILGSNDKIQSIDEINIRQITNDPSGFNLLMEYKAEMSFKGIYWFATLFVMSSLKEVADHAERGAMKKCIQKWGSQCLEQSSKIKI